MNIYQQRRIQARDPQQLKQLLDDVLKIPLFFSQSNIDANLIQIQLILDICIDLQMQPNIVVWKIMLGDFQNLQIDKSKITQLYNYYISLTECSQIFKTQIFKDSNRVLLLLIAIFCNDRDLSDELRHSKCLRSMQRMFRLDCTEELQLAMVQATKNHKNCDYLIIKKFQDTIVNQYRLRKQESNDLLNLIIANMCYTTDHRLLIWCQELLMGFRYQYQLTQIVMLWRLSYDSQEISEELLKNQEYFAQMIIRCKEFSEETAFSVSLIRKLCENNKNFKDQYGQQIFQVFKQLLSKGMQRPQQLIQFIYKELFSYIGLATQFPSQDIVQRIIQIIHENTDDCKLVTTGVGCLTNLTNQQSVLDVINQDKQFYQLILLTFDKYYDKTQLIEYTLKLIINTLPNKTASMQYIQPRILLKLLFTLQVSEGLSTLVIRIFKSLYMVNNPYIDILSQCINEVQSRNQEFNFFNLICTNLEQNISSQNIDSISDGLSLIALFPKLIQNTPKFQNIIKQYVDIMRQKGDLKRALQVISGLPIEDLGLQF